MAALEVVHAIPGRLRLRLPAIRNGDDVAERVRGAPGVTACAFTPLTRSLLILYEDDVTSAGALREVIAGHLGVSVDVAPLPPRPADPPVIATTVVSALGELDAGISRSTRGMLNLRALLPLALTGWALLEVVRGRAAPLAWSSALWYAHGLFRDYDLPSNR